MVVTLAVAPEAGVVVDNDPAQALLSAQAEGLLVYRGYVSGGLYEVEARGRHWAMPAREALLTVERLRLLGGRMRQAAVLSLDEIRDDGSYAINTSKGLLVLPEQEVIHWCSGFLAGVDGRGQPHTGEDMIGVIADLFDHTSRDDQCRMVILGLMHAGPQRVKATDLVRMIGELPGVGPENAPVKKTVVGALGFGKTLSSRLAEQMIAAFGLRWSVTAGPCRSTDGAPAGPLPEMPGLVRLRELVAVSKLGWLRYLGKSNPNDARWMNEYPVSVGKTRYTVPADALLPWLRGLRAFHGE
jgi:hypothetical protein